MPFHPPFMSEAHNGQAAEPRIQVMAIVLVISLLAVSFPGISMLVPRFRIPGIFFFIGKHFGTGVILATAFIHLLQDSFGALQKGPVKEHFGNIGDYTGLIILASLLSIFLIEYFCNSYVEHLHSEPSQPSSPEKSRESSIERSPHPAFSPSTAVTLQVPSLSTSTSQRGRLETSESTPLLHHHPRIAPPSTHPQHNHAHHVHLPALVTQDGASVVPFEVLTNSPRILKMRGCTCAVSRDRSRSRPRLASTISVTSPTLDLSRGRSERVGRTIDREEEMEGDEEQDEKPLIGRRRQVIGLLVLQLGIMIHSLVIGLTLAIAAGSDFTSLTVAVVFHQLFEGLSLGIRIAALPPPPSTDVELSALGMKAQSSVKKGFFQGLLGAGWTLKVIMAILFGITAPAGMGIGMIAFKVGKEKEGIELARMYLIQGVMSAVSAGMLIYASTVEMIAGDFVFGDVEGHSHHDHGHSHDLSALGNDKSRRSDRSRDDGSGGVSGDEEMGANNLTDGDDGDDDDNHHLHDLPHRHGKLRKKLLAVLSLLAGVGGMVLIGLGE
ncbi:hypothetical protein AGABI1DRAFT_108367 [Agaricus bisporus var. burnettii JB137-S8]|uniref:Zinc/iron permease n=1 Tax=Agaricus bisporus var. burnettii (strain JB137-S8 / ATCC MYA-4627 / FGSC 10392) TaxID=597362 RepID=K5VS25_AGABU|nr:uncharacterized protein AGABI1DRAFT_108367 [Agaricus bisporus var. burnettii JB137-S8]EKM77264.1 hypothetical protein AGABI1DRAFT_108367 [Agaricus bisporus var. burnettii JB137-S8]